MAWAAWPSLVELALTRLSGCKPVPLAFHPLLVDPGMILNPSNRDVKQILDVRLNFVRGPFEPSTTP